MLSKSAGAKTLGIVLILLNSVQLFGTDWQDSEYFMLWYFSNSTHDEHEATLMSLTDLKFCRFPSESYVFNNYSEVNKQNIANLDIPNILAKAEKLSIFCIADHEHSTEVICGVEIAHLTRINCAYVFKKLPDTQYLQVYLVPKSIVGEYIAMEDIDSLADSFTTDWSSFAQDLNSDAETPKAAEKHALMLWLARIKNYFMQKAVSLLLYFVE
jgi:hypothetical protein